MDKTESSEEALQGEFTWTVENFTKVKQLKLYSPVFQSGQYNWCARPGRRRIQPESSGHQPAAVA